VTPARPHPAAWLAVLAGAVFVLNLPRSDMLDAEVRFQDLGLVLNGEKPRQKFSMVGPVLATPLYYFGEERGDARRWVWYYNRALVLAGCAGFWWLLRPVLTAAERVRFVAALLLTSMIPHHLMHFSGEVFSALATAFGLAAVVVRGAWWGMPLAVAGVVNTPGTAGGLGLATLVLVARTRRLRYLLAVPAAVGGVLLENYLRRGDPFFTGYDGEHGSPTALPFSGQPEFSYPAAFGLLSLLFSFGKGLVFFVPAVFLPMPAAPGRPPEAEEDLRWLHRVWIGVVVGLLLVYSRWWAWYGGWFWGPRFLLFACFPAALVIARRTADADRFSTAANLLMLAGIALASWVALSGVVYQQKGLDRYAANNHALEFAVWYVPECSVLWWPYSDPEPRPLLWQDPVPLFATVIGFAYLAGPVLATLARRLPGQLAKFRHAIRSGPRLRI
jgi:hypothetical protein